MKLHLAHGMAHFAVLHKLLPHEPRPQILRHQYADPLIDPRTSCAYQFVLGLNASTKPYRVQTLSSYFCRIASSTCEHSAGRKGSDPAHADGTTVPSSGPIAGGPPHTRYPSRESDAEIPHKS